MIIQDLGCMEGFLVMYVGGLDRGGCGRGGEWIDGVQTRGWMIWSGGDILVF